jgi:preprotein translocase subunit SecD
MPFLAFAVSGLGCSKPAAPVKFELFVAESAPREGLKRVMEPATGKAFYLPRLPLVSNVDIQRADTGLDQFGKPSVELVLADKGSQAMTTATRNYEQGPMVLVIILNGKYHDSYNVKTVLSDRLMISGAFTDAEAEAIADGIMVGSGVR